MGFKKDSAKEKAKEKVFPYAPLAKLAKIIRYMFVASVAISVLRIALDVWGYSFIEQIRAGVKVSEDQGLLLDAIVGLGALVEILLHFVLGITFLRWFYLLRRNMSALNAPFFEGHPLDVVGSFLIPIVNLFQPLARAEDIWKATDLTFPRDRHWTGAKNSGLLSAWWWMFIAQNIAHQVAGFFAQESTKKGVSLRELSNVYISSGIAESVSIVAAILAMKVVAALTDRQEKYHAAWLANAEQSVSAEQTASAEQTSSTESYAHSADTVSAEVPSADTQPVGKDPTDPHSDSMPN